MTVQPPSYNTDRVSGPHGLLAQALTRFHTPLYPAGGLLQLGDGGAIAVGTLMEPAVVHPLPAPDRSDDAAVFALGVFPGIASSCCAPVLAGVMTLSRSRPPRRIPGAWARVRLRDGVPAVPAGDLLGSAPTRPASSVNPADQVRAELGRFELTTPYLIDADERVSDAYGVLGTGMHENLPGHSFILIDGSGHIAWRGDYPSMFVDADQLLSDIRSRR